MIIFCGFNCIKTVFFIEKAKLWEVGLTGQAGNDTTIIVVPTYLNSS